MLLLKVILATKKNCCNKYRCEKFMQQENNLLQKNYLKATKILVAFNYILVVKIHVVVAYNIFCNKR